MTSRRLLHLIPLSFALVSGLIIVPVAVGTQTLVSFGRGSRSLEVPVTLTVPTRLSVSQVAGERVLSRTPTYTEVELPVRVAANLGWGLGLSLVETLEGTSVLARTAEGAWRALTTAPLAVLSSEDPTEPTTVLVRLRLPSGFESTAAVGLRLTLSPGIGAP